MCRDTGAIDYDIDPAGYCMMYYEQNPYSCSLNSYGYSLNHCNVGYSPSTEPDANGKQTISYETQEGSNCPCTCYPDNVKYPTAYKSQRNCDWNAMGDSCMDTVKYVTSDDMSCVTCMCICTCMCSHVWVCNEHRNWLSITIHSTAN